MFKIFWTLCFISSILNGIKLEEIDNDQDENISFDQRSSQVLEALNGGKITFLKRIILLSQS
jgi:hypothetical protein